jgi:hypothetical protein
MDCTQALDDFQFEDNTPYKEAEKKQVNWCVMLCIYFVK